MDQESRNLDLEHYLLVVAWNSLDGLYSFEMFYCFEKVYSFEKVDKSGSRFLEKVDSAGYYETVDNTGSFDKVD